MYDVIVVGARCAGASTALVLARRGYRVLLLDRSTFPSDLVASTHMLWQPGVAKLAEWGLAEQLAATGCPPLTTTRFDLGQVVLTGTIPPAGDAAAAYAPRRIVLDRLLVDAAVDAGVEFREAVTVEALRTGSDGTVTGVRARTRASGRFTEDAQLVVGADGMRSTVARLVDAAEHRTRPVLQGTWFGYFADVPLDAIEFAPRTGTAACAWPTNDDLTLVGVSWTAARYPEVRADVEGNFRSALADAAPGLAERVEAGERVGRMVGGSTRNYLRTPFGPGWALVGDAGYLKDPTTAQGMTDALVHAEWLAEAVDEGLSGARPMPEALAAYERRRDEAVLPMYEFTCMLAPFDPPTPEFAALLGSLIGDQERTEQFFGVFAGTVPFDAFSSSPAGAR